jgi:hypothetical protein
MKGGGGAESAESSESDRGIDELFRAAFDLVLKTIAFRESYSTKETYFPPIAGGWNMT